MLGDIFEKSERKDIAGSYYGQIVRNYPLSTHAPDAKAKLKAFNMPIPQPDAKAVAWMTAEQNAPRPKESVVHRSFGMMHSGPDVHAAALSGVPTMEGEEMMRMREPKRSEGAEAEQQLVGGTAGSTGTPSSGVVATVKPGEAAPAGSATGAASEDVNSSTSGSGAPDSANTPASEWRHKASTPTDSSSSSTATTPATANGTATSTRHPTKTDGSQNNANAACNNRRQEPEGIQQQEEEA